MYSGSCVIRRVINGSGAYTPRSARGHHQTKGREPVSGWVACLSIRDGLIDAAVTSGVQGQLTWSVIRVPDHPGYA